MVHKHLLSHDPVFPIRTLLHTIMPKTLIILRSPSRGITVCCSKLHCVNWSLNLILAYIYSEMEICIKVVPSALNTCTI